MGNSSALGSFARKAIAAIILVAVAIMLFKIVVAAIAGLVSMLFGLVILAAVVYAVIWAARKL